MKKDENMRHRIALAVIALAAFTHGALAQPIDGQVTKIDAPAGKITLKHGPIKKLDMDEPMTMVFRAADPAMLTAVKAGDTVKFEAEKINGQFTVIKIEKAAPAKKK